MTTNYSLTFIEVASSETIYDPLTVAAAVMKQVQIYNHGSEDLIDLGIYSVPATNLGPTDKPADYPPETDFQNLLSWGEATRIGDTVSGGLKLEVPQNDDSILTKYISRVDGASLSTKIPIADIPAGESKTINITLENPPAGPTRRLYFNLVVE